MTDPFTRELALIVDEMRSPKAHSRMLANLAQEQIDKTSVENATVIGRALQEPISTVDGRQGAPLGSVKPDGTITAKWNVEATSLRWILTEPERVSP